MRGGRRVLGYARVSSIGQAVGASLEDQQNLIRAHAKKGGLGVARFYVEAEGAGHEKLERREQMRQLLADVRRGDLVLVAYLDRWSRDPEFTYRSMRELREQGVSIYFVNENCDPSTHDGDTMLNFRVLFAREEHKRIKLRTVGMRKTLRDDGYFADGLPSWGYRRQDVRGKDRNVLVVDEDAARLVRDCFRACIRGVPVRAIAEDLGIGKDRIFKALRNRMYLGEVRDGSGKWIRGKHPAIVTASMFAAAADALDARKLGERGPRRGALTDAWWIRVVARCTCGARMGAEYGGPDGTGKRRGYLHCVRDCGTPYLPVPEAEAACEPLVRARIEELRELLAAPPRKRPVVVTDRSAQRAKLGARRDKLLEQHAEGFITTEQLRARLARVDDERTRLDALDQQPEPVDPGRLRALLREVRALRHAWLRATPQERRGIVGAFARCVLLARGQQPRFDWYSAEELAARQ